MGRDRMSVKRAAGGVVVRVNAWVIGGALLFLAGAGVALVGIERGSSELALWSLVGFIGAFACFMAAGWRSVRRVDWDRVEAEQRLWESGRLGRAWLAIRKRLSGQ